MLCYCFSCERHTRAHRTASNAYARSTANFYVQDQRRTETRKPKQCFALSGPVPWISACGKLFTLLDLCVSSLRRGHADLLCIIPSLTDDPRRGSKCCLVNASLVNVVFEMIVDESIVNAWLANGKSRINALFFQDPTRNPKP